MRAFIAFGAALSQVFSASAGAEPADEVWESYRAHLAAAESAARLEEPGRAIRWLQGAPVECRGWEHRYLGAALDMSMATPATLGDTVMAVSLSPDDAVLACGVSSGEIVLVKTSDGSVVRRWKAHSPEGLFRVAFSPDGKQVASCGADRKACVWDSATGGLRTTFDAHKFPVGGLAWSPDGSRIATSAYFTDKSTPIEGRIHTWNPATGELDKTMRAGVKPVVYLAWAGNGETLAAGTWNTHAWMFDPRSGAELHKLVERGVTGGDIRTDVVAISPDGSLVAVGSDVDWVRVYRTADGSRVAEMLDHHADVFALAFSADGKTLASGGADCAIRLWNTSDFTARGTLRGHTGAVRSVVFSSDGSRLYSGSADKTARSWEVSRGTHGPVALAHTGAGYACTFSTDGRTIAGAAYNGEMILWDAATGVVSARADAHGKSPVCHSAFSPDGKVIATCSWDRTVRTFEAGTLKPIRTMDAGAGAAWCVFSPDGARVLAALTNKSAVVLNAENGERVLTLEGHAGRVEQAAFSPDGSLIATASDALRVFDAATGTLLGTSPRSGAIATCAFSPDGSVLVSGSMSGEVRVHDPRTATPIRTLLTTDRPVYRVAFSPDGGRVAAAAIELFILNPQRPGEALRIKPLKETIWDVCFSPDGTRLAAMSWDGAGVVLDARARR
jgi:WD40 repeat protein